MDKPKYLLIVSQYYHSRHCFVVPADENTYRDNAKALITDLEKYKRRSDNDSPVHLGDKEELFYPNISWRWNVNDSGDIYFIPCYSIAGAIHRCKEYWEHSYRDSRGFKRKDILENISNHHNYDNVREIVNRYFVVL